MTQMMKCGHSANATDADGKPCCAICIWLDPNAQIVDDAPPDLTGRFATCYGHSKVPSSSNLAFFKHHPNKVEDEYYCGCMGWD